jgi:hypothetical protein
VPEELAERAVRECSGLTLHDDCVLTFDCRVFYDPGVEDARRHIDTHPLVLERLAQHKHFKQFFTRVLDKIVAKEAKMKDKKDVLHISCFCRSGEKRSVAVAWILKWACQETLGMCCVPTAHLCSFEWPRKNCQGQSGECQEVERPCMRVIHDLWSEIGHRKGYNFESEDEA